MQQPIETSVAESAIDTSGEPVNWFVLTTLDPQRTEEQLLKENERRAASLSALSPMEYFIPYQFLKRRVSQGHDRDTSSHPHSRKSVQTNNETRTVLRRYIFIRARERELDSFQIGRAHV